MATHVLASVVIAGGGGVRYRYDCILYDVRFYFRAPRCTCSHVGGVTVMSCCGYQRVLIETTRFRSR